MPISDQAVRSTDTYPQKTLPPDRRIRMTGLSVAYLAGFFEAEEHPHDEPQPAAAVSESYGDGTG